jgi:hypothetical protein
MSSFGQACRQSRSFSVRGEIDTSFFSVPATGQSHYWQRLQKLSVNIGPLVNEKNYPKGDTEEDNMNKFMIKVATAMKYMPELKHMEIEVSANSHWALDEPEHVFDFRVHDTQAIATYTGDRWFKFSDEVMVLLRQVTNDLNLHLLVKYVEQ